MTADINAPLKADDLIFRVNTAYHTENSFQDAGFRNSFFIGPTLSFKANDRLSFLIITEFMQEEKTNPAMLFLGRSTPLQFSSLDDLNYNRNLSLTSNDRNSSILRKSDLCKSAGHRRVHLVGTQKESKRKGG